MNARLRKVQTWLRDKNLDAACLTTRANIFYLTQFDCDPHERLLALFVFPDLDPFLVCPQMETARVRQAGWSYPVIGYGDADNPWPMIEEQLSVLDKRSAPCIAVESDHLSFERAQSLQRCLPAQAQLINAEGLLQLRAVKDSDEIQVLEEAAALADYGIEAGIQALREGCTEMEIVAEIEYALKKKGVREMPFSTMVLFGEKTGDPHGTPGFRPLQRGDGVLFDLGVVHNGYCSDITRTVFFGEATEEMKKIYETVLKAQESALARCQPGVPIAEVDLAARRVIEEAGYGPYFPHRIGHGLGVEVHEYPSMHQNNNTLLQTGMTFTVEPGIYIPEIGGIRIEDDVVVSPGGPRLLTRFSKELRVVDAS
ncbi:putative dipeptidase YkvY [Marinithermofilum abyssi]|uniref:Putative dipeptidase YkvY n=1 Tax=Marinithermofilum abyssi TaxID=1571185 RepID=A0A8J2VGX9_9BACL|nr:Xaa-Pro peptidase family protein [Marinithermofilum abyssi]GGE10519.1 putative dipeptidase YkvY [Marinithermofilum abyssi]